MNFDNRQVFSNMQSGVVDPDGPCSREVPYKVEVKISFTKFPLQHCDNLCPMCLTGANDSSGGAGPVAPSRSQASLHV